MPNGVSTRLTVSLPIITLSFRTVFQRPSLLSSSTVQAIATHFASSASLSDLRFLFILLVCFADFFRIDEIGNIALRDVFIHSDHMSVYVPQPKNEQYREGDTAFLARTGKVTCPVAVTERLIKLLPQSSSAFPSVLRIVQCAFPYYEHALIHRVLAADVRCAWPVPDILSFFHYDVFWGRFSLATLVRLHVPLV